MGFGGIARAAFGRYWLRMVCEPSLSVSIRINPYRCPGIEDEPSFSPDGSQVAFTWNGEKEDNFDIYVKVIGTERPLRLTSNPAKDYSPAWSPDGRWIAFCRDHPGGRVAVILISPLGTGPEQILTETFFCPVVTNPLIAWSPDSYSLVIVGKDKPDERSAALFLLSIKTREKRKLTSPPVISDGDSCPAFSPDGRSLAFCRWTTWNHSDLYIVALSQDFRPLSEPKRLTFGNWMATIPAWTGDGRALVFSTRTPSDANLWKISLSGPREPQRLATTGQFCFSPTIAHHGHRLAYVQRTRKSEIWRMEVSSSRGEALPPSKFIYTTRMESVPAYSPDGKKVAFMSDRLGYPEWWICDSDGSNQVQLTSLGKGGTSWGILWSPDSSRLTFSWDGEGNREIYVINVNGGLPQRLTTTSSENPWGSGNPSWSRDGRWILFDVAEKDGVQVCKVSPERGPVVKVLHIDGYAPFESPDGKYFYYLADAGLYKFCRIPVEGGKPEHVFDSLIDNCWPVDDGFYFFPRPEHGNDYSIQFLNTTTGNTRRIATIEKPITSLTVSPDRRWILYSQIEQAGNDLMMVENFK